MKIRNNQVVKMYYDGINRSYKVTLERFMKREYGLVLDDLPEILKCTGNIRENYEITDVKEGSILISFKMKTETEEFYVELYKRMIGRMTPICRVVKSNEVSYYLIKKTVTCQHV